MNKKFKTKISKLTFSNYFKNKKKIKFLFLLFIVFFIFVILSIFTFIYFLYILKIDFNLVEIKIQQFFYKQNEFLKILLDLFLKKK